MYKYIGDSILNASFTVQVPKPLDNRTVVNNIYELYSIPAAYAYLGMTVANIDNGNIYMLVDKTKINEKAGWKASYESIQILTCTYAEYKEWEQNTNELFQPIDESKEYLHQDTYYYIYEDSLPGSEENQEYVKRSDWAELLNVVSGKASNDGLARTNQMVAEIIENYATKTFVTQGYAPLSMFDLESDNSFISTNFFTKTEALEKFVKFSDLSGDDPGEGDFIFVTASRYETDQEVLAQYQADLAEELTHFLRVGADGELGNVIISQIKSPAVDNQQLVVNVTPEGFKVGNDRFAMLSDVPPHITLTKAEYDELVANDQVDENVYYHITGDDDTYVLQSELEANYYTITGVQSYVAGRTYSKAQIDEIISGLTFNTPEEIANVYVTKTALQDTLEGYVTIAMLGGEDGDEGTFIFVKQSEYNNDKEQSAQQREQDLQQIETDYVKKDSDASLNSLETATIKNGQNTLSLTDVLKLNNKKLALDEDVPVIRVVSASEYEELTKDPNVYYFVYNTNENLAFVTAEELDNYYTKPQIDSKLVAINQYSDFIKSDLFVQMSIKFNVEKILMERIADNQYYIARASGQHIDITEYAPDQSVLTTTGTGLVSFLRHLITNDTELGNDVLTITLSYNNVSVTMTESGQSTDNPSTVSVQLVTFLRQATGKATGDIKQSDLDNMIIDMRVTKDTVYVDYKIAVKVQQS